jgi:hypothetical protein
MPGCRADAAGAVGAAGVSLVGDDPVGPDPQPATAGPGHPDTGQHRNEPQGLPPGDPSIQRRAGPVGSYTTRRDATNGR